MIKDLDFPDRSLPPDKVLGYGRDQPGLAWYLAEVKEITENRVKEYNEEHSHESLGNLIPVEYLEATSPQETSTFGWR